MVTSGLRATGRHRLKKNNFEEFDFGAATVKHIPLAGELLSAKESATRTASDCAFNSEDAGNSALKTKSYSTFFTSNVYRKFVINSYIILPKDI
jgi:hypothetical protein